MEEKRGWHDSFFKLFSELRILPKVIFTIFQDLSAVAILINDCLVLEPVSSPPHWLIPPIEAGQSSMKLKVVAKTTIISVNCAFVTRLYSLAGSLPDMRHCRIFYRLKLIQKFLTH